MKSYNFKLMKNRYLIVYIAIVLLAISCSAPSAPNEGTPSVLIPEIEPTPSFLPEEHIVLPSPTAIPLEPRNAPATWGGAWTNLDPSNFMAQSFVAVSSSIQSVEVNVFAGTGGSETLTLAVLDADRNLLGQTTAQVGEDGFDGWLCFEFDVPISVTPGKEYIIRLQGTQVWVNWKISPDLYPQGSAIILGAPSFMEDFIFKVNSVAGEDSNSLSEVNYEELPATPPRAGTVDEMISRCPSSEEIADINNDIALAFEGADSDEFVCKASEGSEDLTAFQKSAYQALLAMKMLTFTRPLPWTDLPLYDWFVSTADGIRFRDDISQGSCCSPVRVINIPSGISVHLSPREIWRWADPRSGWGLVQGHVQLFVHEARHIESGPHTCGNLDSSLSEMNAYGVTYYLQLWIAHYLTDPSLLEAQEPYPNYYFDIAKGMAEGQRTLSFCEIPPPISP